MALSFLKKFARDAYVTTKLIQGYKSKLKLSEKRHHETCNKLPTLMFCSNFVTKFKKVLFQFLKNFWWEVLMTAMKNIFSGMSENCNGVTFIQKGRQKSSM